MDIQHALIFLLALATVNSSPRVHQRELADPRKFVGEGTNELATAILQGYEDKDCNVAFSPLGYSTILALLAEGARGDTRQQLASVLRLPEDNALVRSSYNSVLKRLAEKNVTNSPEFRNWFYVYRNFSVEQEYKDILLEHYLTEVKNVRRPEDPYYPEEPETPATEEPESATFPEDVEMEEEGEETYTEQEPGEILIADDSEVQEQVVEVATDSPRVEEEEVHGTTESALKDVVEEALKQKEEEDLEDEIMEAVARRAKFYDFFQIGRSLFNGDISSGMSGNSISRKTDKGSDSLMIVFNGLYFKGSWVTPFLPQNTKTEAFYTSDTKKVLATTMRTQGKFRTGTVPALDSDVIELPYEGGRYALLVVLPKQRDGLRQLVSDLAGFSLCDVYKQLELRDMEVQLPTFNVDTTTKPQEALTKFGITSIFDREQADLTGISKDEGLFVQELVQVCSVQVDESGTSTSQLAVGSLANRSRYEKFVADHPFLFFVRDTVDNLTVVAGKVVDPAKKPDYK